MKGSFKNCFDDSKYRSELKCNSGIASGISILSYTFRMSRIIMTKTEEMEQICKKTPLLVRVSFILGLIPERDEISHVLL